MYDFAMHLYIRIRYYAGSYYVPKRMQEWLQQIITGSMFTQLALSITFAEDITARLHVPHA